MSQRILVVAAHPDDETLGCGGTIAGHTTKGDGVSVLILGEGITSRDSAKTLLSHKKDLKNLQQDAHSAAKILGVRDLRMVSFPDNRFDTVALLDIVHAVEAEIRRYRPHVVYTHHPGDLNIDHRLTFQAVLAATRPMESGSVSEVCSFYIPSASEWSFGSIGPAFRPSVFIDISKTIEKKINAMAVYGSEKRISPHPRSEETLRALAKSWGSAVGLPYAEAFELIRTIRRT